jgi:hypothetical protein
MKVSYNDLMGQIAQENESSPIGIQNYLDGIVDLDYLSLFLAEEIEDGMLRHKFSTEIKQTINSCGLSVAVISDITLRVFFGQVASLNRTGGLKGIGETYVSSDIECLHVPVNSLVNKVSKRLFSSSVIATNPTVDLEDFFLLKKVGEVVEVGEVPPTYNMEKITENVSGREMNRLAIHLINVAIDLFETLSTHYEQEGKKLFRFIQVERGAWLDRWSEVYSSFRIDHLPMRVPPRPWRSAVDGGYYTASMAFHSPFVKRNDVISCFKKYKGYDFTEKLQQVNSIQSVAYRVNTDVLDSIYAVLEANLEIPFLAVYKEESQKKLPTVPEQFATDQERAVFWKSYYNTLTQKESEQSKLRLFSEVISLAETYRDEKSIWFPHNVDYRGRIYPLHTSLSPQGTNIARGLLEFSEGKPIGTTEALDQLAHTISNAYGNDKLSILDRRLWSYLNEELLLSIAVNAGAIASLFAAPLYS